MADIKDINVFQTVTSVSFEVEPNTDIININKVTTTGYSGVPNLQDVTDVGASTTNPITANSFIKSGGTGANVLLDNGNTAILPSIVGLATTTYVDDKDNSQQLQLNYLDRDNSIFDAFYLRTISDSGTFEASNQLLSSLAVLRNISYINEGYTQQLNADKFVKLGGAADEYLMADGSISTGGGGGGGATNLTTTQTISNFTINSNTGADATVPLGNGSLAGATLNDYTTAEKNKLAGIATGAEVNVNADWNATSGDAQILNKPTIPSITNLVPYTGATSDVNLGEFGIQLGNLEFDNTPTNIPTTAGSVYYNDADGTLDLILKGGNVKLQIGQETVIRVVNKTSTNVSLLESNYQAVRITGAQGQRPKVDLAQATNDVLSAETIGLVTETIANNQEGFITTSGLVRGINTTGSLQGETWLDGDILYLSPTVAGSVTKVKPVAPNHLIIIGYVIYAHITQGTIFVKVDNGYELDELHNVKIATPANNSVLAYTLATDIWENKTVETALGYTPANDASVVHIAGTEIITGEKTFSSQTIFGDGTIGSVTYGLTPNSIIGSTTGGVFDIRNTSTNIVAGNTVGTLQFSVKDDAVVGYANAQIKTLVTTVAGSGTSGSTDMVFLTNNSGTGISPTEKMRLNNLGLLLTNETASTIASFDSNKSIKSLTTADGYPSLVELKYVKGVTSSIQTQLDGKANVINQPSKAYAGATPTWTGTTAPSGTTNHTYSWSRIGNIVSLRVSLDYTTTGTAVTQVTFELPSDCPTPELPSGVSANADVINYGIGMLSGNRNVPASPTATYSAIRIKSAGVYEINIGRSSASYRYAYATIQYFTT